VNPGTKNVPKNFYCFRPRDGSAGFRFVAHDFEDTFGGTDVTGHLTTDGHNQVAGATLVYFNPRWLHLQLVQNPRYLQRFGDRVQRNLFNDGALTAAKSSARWAAMRAVLAPAMIAESARWGDAKSATPRTIADWNNACNGLYNPATSSGTLISRPASFISLLRGTSRGYPLFPNVDAPAFSQFGGTVATGFPVTITGPASTQIYYTTNGEDPAAPTAILYSGAIPMNNAVTTLKARAKNTTTGIWSALTEARFTHAPVPATTGNLVLSEFNYNPPPTDPDDLTEFIELWNPSSFLVDLTGVKLTTAVTFTFPSLLLEPGQRIVVIKDQAAFKALHGSSSRIAGVWGGSLNQSGEAIVLQAAHGSEIERVFYGVTLPWPPAAANNGRSLVRISPDLPANSPFSWRPSSEDNGNPAAGDAPSFGTWLASHGFPDANTTSAAGLKALMHFATGTPVTSATPPLVTMARDSTHDTVTFRRVLAAVDEVRFFVEQSPDLSSWPVSVEADGSSATVTGRIANPDGTEDITIRIPANSGLFFYRLRCTTR